MNCQFILRFGKITGAKHNPQSFIYLVNRPSIALTFRSVSTNVFRTVAGPGRPGSIRVLFYKPCGYRSNFHRSIATGSNSVPKAHPDSASMNFWGKFKHYFWGNSTESDSDNENEEMPGPKAKRTTRGEIDRKELENKRWKERKEYYEELPLEEKRTKYAGSYTLLREVQTWTEYYEEHEADILKNKRPDDKAAKNTFKVDEELNSKISIWRGDITSLEIDSIVNAANESLMGGGGVDGAIHRAAGKTLVLECTTLKGCKTGEAKITGGYKLPCKTVIHTVGPIGGGDDLLESCYSTSLQVMMTNNLRSTAFPCISTGIYGFPNERAANIALYTARTFLEQNKDKVDRVIFCLFLPKDVKIYERLMQTYFPVKPEMSPATPKSAKSKIKSPKLVETDDKLQKSVKKGDSSSPAKTAKSLSSDNVDKSENAKDADKSKNSTEGKEAADNESANEGNMSVSESESPMDTKDKMDVAASPEMHHLDTEKVKYSEKETDLRESGHATPKKVEVSTKL